MEKINLKILSLNSVQVPLNDNYTENFFSLFKDAIVSIMDLS